jgi:hypothetical protein
MITARTRALVLAIAVRDRARTEPVDRNLLLLAQQLLQAQGEIAGTLTARNELAARERSSWPTTMN